MELRIKTIGYMLPSIVLPPVLLAAMAWYEFQYSAVVSLAVIVLAILPFFYAFERSRPRPRDMVPIAVMSALGALGRALFAAVPNFKPTSAVVIITGIYFGPRAGFLTGALSALASNMLLGQGPWTPWQMYAWGMIGLFAGLLGRGEKKRHRVLLYLFGFLSGIFFGWFMNLQYIISYIRPVTWASVAAAYASSVVFDVTHGIATVIFLAVLEKPWGKKLRRLKMKYGILDERKM